jgi:hypothetical protein
MHRGGRFALDSAIAAIVSPRGRDRGMPGHLLDHGQVHAGLEQVAGPSPAQVMGSGWLDPRLAPAFLADRPCCGAAQTLQLPLLVTDQASVFEHGAEERAGLCPAEL